MDDVLKQWNIDTSGSQVCDDEKVDFLLSEHHQPAFSRFLIHHTKNICSLKLGCSCHFVDVFDVMSGCAEDNGLLLLTSLQYHLLHNKE